MCATAFISPVVSGSSDEPTDELNPPRVGNADRFLPRARIVGFPDIGKEGLSDELRGRLSVPFCVDNGTNVYLLSGSDGRVAGAAWEDREYHDSDWTDPSFSIALKFLKARCSRAASNASCTAASQRSLVAAAANGPGHRPDGGASGGFISHTQLLTRGSGSSGGCSPGRFSSTSSSSWGCSTMCCCKQRRVGSERSPTSVLSGRCCCSNDTESSAGSVGSSSRTSVTAAPSAHHKCQQQQQQGSTTGRPTYAAVAAHKPTARPMRPLPTAGFAARAAALAAAKRRAKARGGAACTLAHLDEMAEEVVAVSGGLLAPAAAALPAAPFSGTAVAPWKGSGAAATAAGAQQQQCLPKPMAWPAQELPLPCIRAAGGKLSTTRALQRRRSMLRVRRESECHLCASACSTGLVQPATMEAYSCWAQWAKLQRRLDALWYGVPQQQE